MIALNLVGGTCHDGSKKGNGNKSTLIDGGVTRPSEGIVQMEMDDYRCSDVHLLRTCEAVLCWYLHQLKGS